MTRVSAAAAARTMIFGGLVAASAILTAASPAAVLAATPVPPHIVAKPNNLMVNTKTALTGTGFPANTTLQISECSKTSWNPPTSPCDTNNVVTVTTSPLGVFHASMTAEFCPPFPPAGPSQVCYIGWAHPTGLDTIRLIGAARIIVTGP